MVRLAVGQLSVPLSYLRPRFDLKGIGINFLLNLWCFINKACSTDINVQEAMDQTLLLFPPS